jgi:hypothetical protein
MMPEKSAFLSYTIEHFKEIARQNRFAENNKVEHQENRCLICHPETFPADPFIVYLRVVAEAVKVRRPCLDQGLIDEINSDLRLMGEPGQITMESLLEGNGRALRYWSGWVREALSTGLGLVSIHSNTSLEFALEEAEDQGLGDIVEDTVKEIMAFQKQNTGCAG